MVTSIKMVRYMNESSEVFLVDEKKKGLSIRKKYESSAIKNSENLAKEAAEFFDVPIEYYRESTALEQVSPEDFTENK